MSNEIDHEDWKELRARVDSIANAIFLIAGGAITLSVSAILKLKSEHHIQTIDHLGNIPAWSWSLLLSAIICFVILKAHLVLQAYSRTTGQSFYSNVSSTNKIGWIIGGLGLLVFLSGMVLLVIVAIMAT